MTPTRKAFILSTLLYLLLLLALATLFSKPNLSTENLKPVPITLNMFAEPAPTIKKPSPIPTKTVTTHPVKQPIDPIQKSKPKTHPLPKPQLKPKSKPHPKILPKPLKPKRHAVTPPKVTKPLAKPQPIKTQKPSVKNVKKPLTTQPPATKITSQPSKNPTFSHKTAATYKPIEQKYLKELSQKIAYYAQQNYPYRARRRHQQGTVQLRFTLHPDGHITHIKVQTSSGHELLDQAALAVIQQQMHAQFKPFPPEIPQKAKILVIPIHYSLK